MGLADIGVVGSPEVLHTEGEGTALPHPAVIDAYIRAAMQHARLECVDDVVAATVPEAFGLVALGATEQDCLDDLRAQLEDWVRGSLADGETLPVIDGIALSPENIQPPGAQHTPTAPTRPKRYFEDEAQLQAVLSRWERDS
ncbi:MAG TPA: hypothetical protein VKV26_09030 [Dehalococcoidia bacterium]|nr:hypothetical protein [Dehalococcoidia bacterium]